MKDTTQGAEINLNRGLPLALALLLPTIGGMVFIVQPGFVQGLVESGGFTDKQAGYLSSFELGGFAVANIAMTIISTRVNWRSTLILSLIIAALANLACIWIRDFNLFAGLRVLSGLGLGGAVSVGFGTIGLTRKPDRNYGVSIAITAIYGALFLWKLPAFINAFALNGMLVLFVILAVGTIPLSRYAPEFVRDHAQNRKDVSELSPILWMPALTSIFFYFMAQSAVWAYLFLVGTSSGATDLEVAAALTLSQVGGVVGALFPALVGERFGRLLPLTISIAASAIPLLILVGGATPLAFTIIVCVYYGAWNMTHPYLLATYASFDATGRKVVYAVALQTTGMAVGPAVAAALITDGNYTPILWLGIGLFIASFVTIVPAALAQLRMKRAAFKS